MRDLEWHYLGDVNIRHGGFYWRNDAVHEDSVHVVKVIPYRDADGPDNLFRIKVGLLEIPEEPKVTEALAFIGLTRENTQREDVIAALVSFYGIDDDEDYVLRIGTPDPHWEGREENNPQPEVILRSNTSLRKWITREYLHKESPAEIPRCKGY